jgi:hypothetical protein
MLQEAWWERLSLLTAAGKEPAEATVFSTASPWEKADYYFSPGAAQILSDFLARHGGTECDVPKTEGLALIFGNDSGWELLKGGRPSSRL